MRLYRRKKCWWCAWTEDGITIRRSTRCESKAAAQLVAERWERERADPAHAAATQTLVADEARGLLTEMRRAGKCDGTLNMYECKIGHVVRLLPEQMIRVDVAAIDAYFEARRGEGSSPSTLYKEWIAMRALLRYSARRGRWIGDLAVVKPKWVTPGYVPRTRHLTWAQMQTLLEELAPMRRATIAWALATGARRAEIFRAERADVDTEAWTAHLRGTKTEKSDRTIPIPEPLRPLLTEAVAMLDAIAADRPEGDETPVTFARWESARRDLSAACKRIGTRLAAAAGDTEPDAWRTHFAPVTWNDLRRSFASFLVQAGVSNEVVAKLLGHATTAMVDRVYGRQTVQTLADLLRRQIRVPPVYQNKVESSDSEDA